MKRKLRDKPLKWRAAPRNGRPRKVLLRHASDSRALRYADLDLRSTAGKEYRARVTELTAHVGGDPTVPQVRLIDHAARLYLLARLAWDELSRTGAFRNGDPRPAFDAFRRAAADEREVLRTLGIERRAKLIPDLNEYLQTQGRRYPPLRLKGPVEEAE
jgi:hypothetical protein